MERHATLGGPLFPGQLPQYIRRLTRAGFGKRILFGSDQMVWPESIERSVEVIQQDPYLTAEQKRDILYNNAVRFLRLDR